MPVATSQQDPGPSRRRPAFGRILLLAAVLAAAAGRPPQAADWPRWRGASFDGTSPETGVFPEDFHLEVKWRRHLGSGYSGIVIAGGRAVTMFSDGETDHLIALDAATGDTLWRTPIAPTYRGREGANDGPVSTPAIAGETIYAMGPRGDLLAVRAADGTILWRTHLVDALGAETPHWGFGGSPLIAGDRLIVPAGGRAGIVVALDRRTGTPVWHARRDEVSYQSPMLVDLPDRRILLAAGDHELIALDPETGEELWSMTHGGEGFYRRIINPVLVHGADLLLTYQPDAARLYHLLPDGDGAAPVPGWTTRHLARNYATPVAHDGHVFGYSGGLLTSIDARDGSLDWRSRPPGNGFPILVDGRLVVLTKEGSLHVIDADPAAYRERARMDLFPNLAWTPPSFAGGRIYARDSFEEVACVGIRAAPAAEAAGRGGVGLLPGSRFGRWVDSLRGVPDAAARVSHFLAGEKTFPLIEDGRFVHLLYRGKVRDIAVRGNMLAVGQVEPMHHVEGTDLYTFSFELEPDARINYQFVRDLDEPIPDPRNPRRSAALQFAGEVSQLFMPESAPIAIPPLRHGRIETFRLSSERVRVGAKTWGGDRDVKVYVPDAAAEKGRRFPTVYVLYGDRMLDAGLAALLDDPSSPRLVVFVPSISPYEYARSQRGVHADMIVEQLVPLVDSRYPTRPDPAQRAIVGADEAAVSALELGMRRPAIFGTVVAQSVFPVGVGDEELLEAIGEAPGPFPRVWLDWGRHDPVSPVRHLDVPGFNRRLRDALVARGFQVTAREWNDGSDLLFWAARGADAIERVFPPSSDPPTSGASP
ncbi:MAG: PQQ-binding-like beta-propeller repeat protein [Acidobacteriota bacterium]|jgi:outer membrane protein assembly factor BamB/enterochelin esterase-like enzyme